MQKPIKVKDLKVGMVYQPFSWKLFEKVVSIGPSFMKDCVLINGTLHLHKESYTYIEVEDETQL